ncbi:MAG: hypothetical protein V9H26_03315 [Verrucomicrobiota bacterium]
MKTTFAACKRVKKTSVVTSFKRKISIVIYKRTTGRSSIVSRDKGQAGFLLLKLQGSAGWLSREIWELTLSLSPSHMALATVANHLKKN